MSAGTIDLVLIGSEREQQKPQSELDPSQIERLWSRVMEELKVKAGEAPYQIWIEPLKPLHVVNQTLLVSAPAASRAWVNKRYGKLLSDLARGVSRGGISIELVDEQPSVLDKESEAPPRNTEQKLNPHYTFQQFIIGECNHLAHAASLTVAELPAQAYNPLFIYGPTGVGKTHLLQAIANHTTLFSPHQRTVYTTVESFTNHFVSSLRKGSIGKFKNHYRGIDLLIVDDIQFLEGKEQTQEEFFHTFNELYQHGAQIVLSSDRRPHELARLHERLKSRFSLGLSIDISPPDYQTRLAVLHKRVKSGGIEIENPDFIETIAREVTGSVRAVEGALVRTVAYSSLSGQAITSELTEQVIKALYGREQGYPVTAEGVVKAVCDELGVSAQDIRSSKRSLSITYPRHLAMYLTRELTDLSLPRIAREFNRSDHTTVLNAVKRVQALSSSDSETLSTVRRIKSRLGL